MDIKTYEFSPTKADEFLLLDLRDPEQRRRAVTLPGGTFDEVYQLAADMGGMDSSPWPRARCCTTTP